MANKFVVIPRELYQGLLSADLQERAPMKRAGVQAQRVLHRRALNPRAKTVQYQQQLRSFLRLRKRAKDRPIRVRMENGPAAMLVKPNEEEDVQEKPEAKPIIPKALVSTGDEEEEWAEAPSTPRVVKRKAKAKSKEQHLQHAINMLFEHVKKEPGHFGLSTDGESILSRQFKKPIEASNTKQSIEYIVRRLPGSPVGTTSLRQKLAKDPLFKQLMEPLQFGEGKAFKPAKWTSR